MSSRPTISPVAFFIFNRPETTARVFAEIAKAKPLKLLVVADGPRLDHPKDTDKCAATRTIIEHVDWPCEVLTNYAETNLGCRRRVSSGLDWVFQTVEKAIILEDDCLPHPMFFPFCEELLNRYRNETRVMHISGDNFLGHHRGSDASYYFSHYPHVWGWASWRRAWQHYDVNIQQWIASPNKALFLKAFDDSQEQNFWKYRWNRVCTGKIDTWDYQWVFACIAHGGLSIVPKVNLVTNIGFGLDSTHTSTGKYGYIPSGDLAFPLNHPVQLLRDIESDRRTAHEFFSRPSIARLLFRKLKRILRF